jgi:hypothetical protein
MATDLQTVLDEKEELITERDAYKCKVHRLNHELNAVLKGDNKKLVDIDALVMENRYFCTVEVFIVLKVEIKILVIVVCYLGYLIGLEEMSVTSGLIEIGSPSKTSLIVYTLSYIKREQSKKLLLHYAFSNENVQMKYIPMFVQHTPAFSNEYFLAYASFLQNSTRRALFLH